MGKIERAHLTSMKQLADQRSFCDSHRDVSLQSMALAKDAQIELRIVPSIS